MKNQLNPRKVLILVDDAFSKTFQATFTASGEIHHFWLNVHCSGCLFKGILFSLQVILINLPIYLLILKKKELPVKLK